LDGNCAHPLEADQGIYDKDYRENKEKKKIEEIKKTTRRKEGRQGL
jgi:hypothetical protein